MLEKIYENEQLKLLITTVQGSRKCFERGNYIPANISSETSGLTWRQVKRGKGH